MVQFQQRNIVVALPVAAAIGVFGVIFGAAARDVLGPGLTLASSVVVFSGAAQFTMVGMLGAGALPAVVLGAVAVLSLRHLALGALLRPRLEESTARRAGLAWFLIDETAGLALTAPERTSRTLAGAGVLCYAAWVGGTGLGLAGAQVAGLESVADALLPVLFVGLASLMATRRDLVARAVAAAALTLGMLSLWPGAGGVAALLAAVVVALPGDRR